MASTMDNAGYEREGDRDRDRDRDRERRSTVELGAVEPPGNGRVLTGCSDHCLKLHQQYELHQHQLHLDKAQGKPQQESPWHHLKTIFLVGTILFLAIWILVYTLLSQLEML